MNETPPDKAKTSRRRFLQVGLAAGATALGIGGYERGCKSLPTKSAGEELEHAILDAAAELNGLRNQFGWVDFFARIKSIDITFVLPHERFAGESRMNVSLSDGTVKQYPLPAMTQLLKAIKRMAERDRELPEAERQASSAENYNNIAARMVNAYKSRSDMVVLAPETMQARIASILCHVGNGLSEFRQLPDAEASAFLRPIQYNDYIPLTVTVQGPTRENIEEARRITRADQQLR